HRSPYTGGWCVIRPARTRRSYSRIRPILFRSTSSIARVPSRVLTPASWLAINVRLSSSRHPLSQRERRCDSGDRHLKLPFRRERVHHLFSSVLARFWVKGWRCKFAASSDRTPRSTMNKALMDGMVAKYLESYNAPAKDAIWQQHSATLDRKSTRLNSS